MAKIYIYGEVYGGFSASEVKSQIVNIPEGEEIQVYINSPGGSVNEGFAIYDILATSPNPITTIGEGLVGSIATVIFLAGSKRKLTKNARFFVHNPIVHVNGLTADELADYSEKMREIEEMILNFYAKKLGLGARAKKQLHKLMQEETTLSAEAAIEYGFATEIVEEIMAMAKLDNEGVDMGLMEKLGLKKPNQTEEIKNLKLTTEDGLTLDIQTKEKHPAVGMDVLIDNNKASDGEYFVPGMAKNIVVKEGKIQDILVRELELEKEVNDEKAEEVADQVQAKLNEKPEIEAKEKENLQILNRVENLESNLTTTKALAKSVADQAEITADQGNRIQAQATFIEVQSKAIEDIKAEYQNKFKEQDEKHNGEIEALKKELTEYKAEVEEVLRTVVSQYKPPVLNQFGGEDVIIKKSPLREKQEEIRNKN